ncbi:MAG: kynureninase [Gammaproteobacteria bacterium]|nr:kynureninase [Gammaproteobacteria bacterium]MDH3374246.1 kynureninase [Gammaproteobacteria bacterium]MDH3410001.1 kynureninase [Gammaproteobacteria bacterium]MDH3551903.1 kynureninase [Gammaproteobacteria bacterium]
MTTKTRTDLQDLDRVDPLAGFREEFFLPKGVIYLNGNSLGAMPLAAAERAKRVVEYEWAEGLIGSMNTAGWYELPSTLGRKIAPLVGAKPNEVVLTDATGIDLYKVVAAALKMQPERRVIVMEGSNFPTNNYMVQGLLEELDKGHAIRFAEANDLMDAIDEDVAAICITQVHYKTGRIHDMAALTQKAHAVGAAAVWDLCHSAGAMPVDLNGCNVDFAVGCTYKYINGGPGAPALLFAAERHHGKYTQPLTGWYGHAAPFDFERDYRPAGDIRQMLTGTQATASLSMAEIGIDIMLRADINAIREKSMRMTDLFIELVEERCGEFGFELVSPRDATQRGSQVSFRNEDGYPIVRALHDSGVICDYRAPANVRFGFAPLYIRYVDVWDAVDRLHDILDKQSWKETRYQVRAAVT